MNKPAVKSIKVKYFASLREQAAIAEESLSTSLATYRELYQFLANQYHFSLADTLIKVAVDDEFADLDDAIQANVCIVFIPPVAGG